MRTFLLIAAATTLVSVASMIAPAAAASDGFQPGHIYISEFIDCVGQFRRSFVREIDPLTGMSSILADGDDGLCAPSRLEFSPDGLRLRVGNVNSATVVELDSNGNGAVILDNDDGLWLPLCLTWGLNGDFYVGNQNIRRVLRFPAAGGAGEVYLEGYNTSDLAFGPDGSLFFVFTIVRRLSSSGEVTVVDGNWGANESVRAARFDSRGNLFVGTKDAFGHAQIYRYTGIDASSRQWLAGGFIVPNADVDIVLAPDERSLYVVTFDGLREIDLATGSVALLATPDGDYTQWGYGITVYIPPPPGDLNCDRRTDFFDIDPFLLALFDPPGYAARFSFCRIDLADMNADGSVDFLDIDGFLAALFAE